MPGARCPLPTATLPDGAFIFHRFLDEKLYNGGSRSSRLITESYADLSLAAGPSRRSCFSHEPDILKYTETASPFAFTFCLTFIN